MRLILRRAVWMSMRSQRMSTIESILQSYQPDTPLDRAATIPAAYYTDTRVHDLERRSVFGNTWQCVARLDQVSQPGQFVTADVAGEPVVIVRGQDGALRGFFNVCRHHAAAVMTEAEGRCSVMQCPYHAWTYGLDGALKGMPEWEGVNNFDRADYGLMPIRVEAWENFVFAQLGDDERSLSAYLGDMAERVAPLKLTSLRFFERRTYDLACNWKVYVDNYLDGGYHVPHVHKSLTTVLDYAAYKIETCGNYCLQWSPMTAGKDDETASVRKGDTAYYYWVYPNFMLNWYEGVMDTNLVLPLGVDRCRVIFDFFFADVGPNAMDHNEKSMAVGERVQQEDIGVCESVQRGLRSKAYDVGRLSVRREAGEHQFHRLLHADLMKGAEA